MAGWMAGWCVCRYAGQEAWVGMEYLVGALVSTHDVADLQKVNPFLDHDVAQEVGEAPHHLP